MFRVYIPLLQCYTSDQLMDIFEINDVISDDQAMEICPALIHQLKSQSCKSSHHDHHPYKKNKSGYTEAMGKLLYSPWQIEVMNFQASAPTN